MARIEELAGRTAIVCGGSKGIGFSTAAEIVRRGGSVAVLARGRSALEEAAEHLRRMAGEAGSSVEIIQADATDIDDVRSKIEAFVSERGVPNYLINSVGYAHPGHVADLGLDVYRRQMEVNYYGQLVPTLVMLPHLLEAGRGHIAFVSSMMGFMGIIGYAAYAPSKYALVGLAEALRHELRPTGIRVSVLYPPDTDTPGFEVENTLKPPETAELSAKVRVVQPDDVARQFVDGIVRGRFHILPSGARTVWRLQRYVPQLVRAFVDRDLRKARGRTEKS